MLSAPERPVSTGRKYVHPAVQAAFTDEGFDPAPLFSDPERAGLTRCETALLRLLERKAGK